jgi:hypothetical protein
LHIQAITLARPLDTEFPCLVYEVEDRAAVNKLLISDNVTRPVRVPEKRILVTSGDINRKIGQESIKDYYGTLLSQANYKDLKNVFCVDVLARVVNKKVPGVTNTLMSQIINGFWGRTFQMKSYSIWYTTFLYSENNVQAMVDLFEDNLPGIFEDVIKTHPTITNWARNGKDLLIGAMVKLFNDKKATLFPDAPKPVKSTVSKNPKSGLAGAKPKPLNFTEAAVETTEPKVASIA